MSPQGTAFSNAKILVVEDEYFLASDLADAIDAAGAEVIGPTGRLNDALELAHGQALDLAVLDVNLRGEMVFDLLDKLLGRDVPVILATGYGRTGLPERYRACHLVEKPYKVPALLTEIARHLKSAPAA